MKARDFKALAKATSVITNIDERRIAKAAIIRFCEAHFPLFDPAVFGKHVEDFHQEWTKLKQTGERHQALVNFVQGNAHAETTHFKMVNQADPNVEQLLLATNVKDAALEALESLAWGICNHDGDVRECSGCGLLFDPEDTDDPQNACCEVCRN